VKRSGRPNGRNQRVSGLRFEAVAGALREREEVQSVPHTVGGEVVATAEQDAAALVVVAGDHVEQRPGDALPLARFGDDELHEPDLIARQVEQRVAGDGVAVQRDEQRALLSAFRDAESGRKPTVRRDLAPSLMTCASAASSGAGRMSTTPAIAAILDHCAVLISLTRASATAASAYSSSRRWRRRTSAIPECGRRLRRDRRDRLGDKGSVRLQSVSLARR
jgi:hypothetical protein